MLSKEVLTKNLHRIMKTKKLYAKDICEKSGIKPQNFSKYLSGERVPSLCTIDKIGKALDTNTTELVSPLNHIYFSESKIIEAAERVIRKSLSVYNLSSAESEEFVDLLDNVGGWKALMKHLREEKLLRQRGQAFYEKAKRRILRDLENQNEVVFNRERNRKCSRN